MTVSINTLGANSRELVISGDYITTDISGSTAPTDVILILE